MISRAVDSLVMGFNVAHSRALLTDVVCGSRARGYDIAAQRAMLRTVAVADALNIAASGTGLGHVIS
jgi:hypothetical protein